MKGSIEPATLRRSTEFAAYGGLCGAMLARAHGQSPAARAISAYLGRSERFADAVATWAAAYADATEGRRRGAPAALGASIAQAVPNGLSIANRHPSGPRRATSAVEPCRATSWPSAAVPAIVQS